MGVRNRLWGSMRRLRDSQEQRSQDRFARRTALIAATWQEARSERRREAEPTPVIVGESNFARGQVPYGVDLAAAWVWRLLVIGLGIYVLGTLLARFQVVVLPLVIALLLTALIAPLVNLLERARFPRGLATMLVVVGSLGVITLLLTFAGQQIAQGANDLANQVVTGLETIRVWLRDGPLGFSDRQINSVLTAAQDTVTSSNSQLVSRVGEVGSAVTNIFAGFFIVLFSTFFFLSDGARIWSWIVRLFPRVSRAKADSSGRVAWLSLTRFVRATVLVAFTDALGIMLVAMILKVPFVLAIGVLVFLTAFIPLIGATLSGIVAVLVALVDQGPIVALLMLGGVVLVQQIEAHVLQPFLLGRLVALHPLGVIVAIATGVILGGIAGALVAVPLVAALNAVVLHLAEHANGEIDADEVEPNPLKPDADGDSAEGTASTALRGPGTAASEPSG